MATQLLVNATASGITPDAAIPAAAQPLQTIAPGAAETAGQAASHSGSLFESLQQGSLGGYFEMLAILFGVLALLWFCLWLLKRFGGKYLPGSAPLMQIESRLSIAPKRWIMVVRVQSKRLVIGVSEEHITLLAELSEQESFESAPSVPQEQKAPKKADKKKVQGAAPALSVDFAEMFAEISKDKKE